MKKNTQVFLFVTLIVLLGLATSLSFLLFGPQHDPLGQSAGMQMFMQPGMMRRSTTLIRSEYEYLVHMIPHHEEAVLAANSLKDNTEREEIRAFAEGIIRTQNDEIEQMKAWLDSWYPEEPHEIDYQPMMRTLEGLEGDAVDEAFIEDMIPHHMEAVMMSQRLLARRLAEHDEVAALARKIRDNQRDEIHLMMGWLSDWNGTDSTFLQFWSKMMWVAFVPMAILIAIVVWMIMSISAKAKKTKSRPTSAKELLDMRYVKDEISQEEYREVRKKLEN